jgi:hypothetical protein
MKEHMDHLQNPVNYGALEKKMAEYLSSFHEREKKQNQLFF